MASWLIAGFSRVPASRLPSSRRDARRSSGPMSIQSPSLTRRRVATCPSCRLFPINHGYRHAKHVSLPNAPTRGKRAASKPCRDLLRCMGDNACSDPSCLARCTAAHEPSIYYADYFNCVFETIPGGSETPTASRCAMECRAGDNWECLRAWAEHIFTFCRRTTLSS